MTKQEKIIEEIATSKVNPSDSEYWKNVAGFKIRMQYRFDYYDLFVKADSYKMNFDANRELDAITARWSEKVTADGERNRKSYALYFSDGTQAGVALLDTGHKEQMTQSALKNLSLTKKEKEDLLYQWHLDQEVAAEEDNE